MDSSGSPKIKFFLFKITTGRLFYRVGPRMEIVGVIKNKWNNETYNFRVTCNYWLRFDGGHSVRWNYDGTWSIRLCFCSDWNEFELIGSTGLELNQRKRQKTFWNCGDVILIGDCPLKTDISQCETTEKVLDSSGTTMTSLGVALLLPRYRDDVILGRSPLWPLIAERKVIGPRWRHYGGRLHPFFFAPIGRRLKRKETTTERP